MRKKRFKKNIGILVSNETSDQLIEVTDRLEITAFKIHPSADRREIE